MVFLGLLLIPVLVAVGFYVFSGEHITLKEFAVHMGVQFIVALVSMAIIYHQNTADTEVWNGRIERKARERVSCSHSYSCNCHESCSGSGSSRSCSTQCDTCYDHPYDVDWNLYTTNREKIRIDRIDRQGLGEPPRWTVAKVGDPTAQTHSYVNYIKANPNTLFRRAGDFSKWETHIPEYPLGVYNYHYLDRVRLTNGIAWPSEDLKAWNVSLQELNAQLGPQKQSNIVLVVTRDPIEFAYALEYGWLGGKKNDIVVILGVEDTSPTSKINWVHVLALSNDSMVKVATRSEIMELGKLDRAAIMSILNNNVSEHYSRKSMKEFEYLTSSIVPTKAEWTTGILVGVFFSIALGIFFYTQDAFEEAPRYGWRR